MAEIFSYFVSDLSNVIHSPVRENPMSIKLRDGEANFAKSKSAATMSDRNRSLSSCYSPLGLESGQNKKNCILILQMNYRPILRFSEQAI